MQPSMFNVRVPLDGSRRRVPDEHVHRRAADRLAATSSSCSIASDAASRRSPTTSARRSSTLARERLRRRRAATRSAQQLDEFFRDVREDTDAAARHGADDAAVQLRLRLLLPGRPRRLQQDAPRRCRWRRRRASATGSSSGSTRSSRRASSLTFFGGEPLLNLPVLYYLAERLHAACEARGVQHADQHHHQRPAADARRWSIG